MAIDTHGRFFFDKPERQDGPDGDEKTDINVPERSDQAKNVKGYPRKKALVDAAATRTKDSILDKYGNYISDDQKERIGKEIVPSKYEVYNERYFLNTKLQDIPPDERANILGFHEVKNHEIALKDNDDKDELQHVTTHETMHSLSYQGHLYEQGNGKWDEIEMLGYRGEKSRTGIREITYQNTEIPGSVEKKLASDANLGLNEGLTEMYTLREIRERGEEPGIAAYTKEVGWAMKLEECVGQETMGKAYFGGDLPALKAKVDELGGAPGTWESLSGSVDWHAQLRSMEIASFASGNFDAAATFASQKEACERGINEILRTLNRKRIELDGDSI